MDGCFPIGFDVHDVLRRTTSYLQFGGTHDVMICNDDDDTMVCNDDDDTMVCNEDDVITTSCLHTKLNLKRNRCASPPMTEDS